MQNGWNGWSPISFESEDGRNKTPVPACFDGLQAVSVEYVQQSATCKPALQHQGMWLTFSGTTHGLSNLTSVPVDLTEQAQPSCKIKPSYLHNVMCVLFCPVPAPQLHPSVQWAPPSAGLCAEQVILWIEMMGDSQAYLSRDEPVHVPVNCHAVNVPPCMDIV